MPSGGTNEDKLIDLSYKQIRISNKLLYLWVVQSIVGPTSEKESLTAVSTLVKMTVTVVLCSPTRPKAREQNALVYFFLFGEW